MSCGKENMEEKAKSYSSRGKANQQAGVVVRVKRLVLHSDSVDWNACKCCETAPKEERERKMKRKIKEKSLSKSAHTKRCPPLTLVPHPQNIFHKVQCV